MTPTEQHMAKAREVCDLVTYVTERAGEGTSARLEIEMAIAAALAEAEARGHCDGRALVATEARGLERAAQLFDRKAETHAMSALWMGRNRERWEGVPPAATECVPMNGPAIAYSAAISDARAIRALATTPESPHD